MLPWLQADAPFPPLERALREPNGLLAAGADLSPGRLLDAYSRGIFPWFSEGDPILWWSPDPRMVLFCDEIRVRRSLAKVLRNRPWEIRFDHDFDAVIRACSEPRDGQHGTWITGAMVNAYRRMHALGHAHSVETWVDGRLAGGLYGMAVGRMFFGESMFTRVPDASKIALVALTTFLRSRQYPLVDCQMRTPHLASMGARELPRAEFAERIRVLVHYDEPPSSWAGQEPGRETLCRF